MESTPLHGVQPQILMQTCSQARIVHLLLHFTYRRMHRRPPYRELQTQKHTFKHTFIAISLSEEVEELRIEF